MQNTGAVALLLFTWLVGGSSLADPAVRINTVPA